MSTSTHLSERAPERPRLGDPLLDRYLEFVEARARYNTDFAERPRTGLAGRSDRSYAALSALYVEVIDSGAPRPIRAVADRWASAEKTVQNHLFKARERGLLTSRGHPADR